MDTPNLLAAWIAILAGALAGAIQGLFFHRDNFLGGYSSWPRRMLRLAHISFFGLAFLNLAFALTVGGFHWPPPSPLAAYALIAAAFLMPAVCYLSAWRKPFRHLFCLPVACVLFATLSLLLATNPQPQVPTTNNKPETTNQKQPPNHAAFPRSYTLTIRRL